MRKQWTDTLERYLETKVAHTFVLHGNVSDVFIRDGEFLQIHELVPKIQRIKNSSIIAFFNLATGIRFSDEKMKSLFLLLIIKPILEKFPEEIRPSPEDYFEERKRDIKEVINWFDKLLAFSWDSFFKFLEKMEQDSPDQFNSGIKVILRSREVKEEDVKDMPFATVVFEYQESHTPSEAATGECLDRMVVVAFQWWAQNKQIRKTNNVILLLSDWIGSIASQLHVHTKGIVPIEIPMPSRTDYVSALDIFKKEGIWVPVFKDFESGQELNPEEISRTASGVTGVELEQIFREAGINGENGFSADGLFKKKTDIIENKLGDIVSLRLPDWGWEAIGGLDDKVAMAMIWVELVKSGNIGRLPKGGILLVGAPGTCKTAFVEAFAHECGLPFVEAKNLFDPYLGMSEKRTQLLVDTLKAMQPVVLFLDEIDKMFLPAGQVYHGDAGAFSRTQRIWMQFMSDPTIHGKVIIFGATNKPHLMESALKRAGRFGAILPFLIPTKEERPDIWRALLVKETIRLSASGLDLDVSEVIDNEELIQKLSEMCDFWINDEKRQLLPGPPEENVAMTLGEGGIIPLTGAEMEDIIGLSLQPFLDEEMLARKFPREELVALLKEKYLGADKCLKIVPDMLIEAMKNHLPPDDIASYRKMNDLALSAVKDQRYIPPAYRDKARRLRAKPQDIQDFPV